MVHERPRVVVTGLGAVSPAGNILSENWRNFQTDISFISATTVGRDHYQSTQLAGMVRDFEPGLYAGRKQYRRSDFYAHFGMAAGIQAMQDSGLLITEVAPSPINEAVYRLPERFDLDGLGVIVGIAVGGSRAVERAMETMMLRHPDRIDPLTIPKLNPARVATDIAKMTGALNCAFTINSACASGTQAILEAYRKIKDGHADVMLAGGADSSTHAVAFYAFDQLKVLSHYEDFKQDPSKASRPLNQNPTGLVISEGAGMMVLERLDRALARDAKIYAEIAGGAFFTDPRDELVPTFENEVKLIRKILASSEMTPAMFQHANMHAAGSIGDSVEIAALEFIFGEQGHDFSITAPKSRIGHLMGGTGVEAVIAVKEVAERIITPTANLNNPIETKLYIPTRAEERDIYGLLKLSLGLDGQFAGLAFRKFVL